MNQKKTPLIGIGSPFALDVVGIRAVEHLRDSGFSPGINGIAFEFLTLDRPGLTLLDILRTVDLAIMIDAMVSGKPLGTVVRLDRSALPQPSSTLTSHEVGLSAVLHLGEILGFLPRTIFLYGIEIDPPLSPSSPSPDLIPSVTDTLRHMICKDLEGFFEAHPVTDRTRRDLPV